MSDKTKLILSIIAASPVLIFGLIILWNPVR